MESTTEMESTSEVDSSTEMDLSTEMGSSPEMELTTDMESNTTEAGEVGLYSEDGSQAANILNYVTIGISIVVLLAAIIYLQRKKK